MTNLNFNHIFNACILCILKSNLYHRNKCIVFSGLLDSGMLTFMIIYLINYYTNICFLPFIFSSKQGGRRGGLGGRIQGQRAVLVICGEGTQLGLWLCYLCSQGSSTEQPGLCPSYREQWGGRALSRDGRISQATLSGSGYSSTLAGSHACPFSTVHFLFTVPSDNNKFREHGFRFYSLVQEQPFLK